MTYPSDHFKEQEPVAEEPAVTPEPEKKDDTAPLTIDEFRDAGREVLETIKHGVFVPMYKLGRRYMRGARGAADEFFGEVANDRDKDKR